MNIITILWNTAVFLAAAFSASIVCHTLKSKYNRKTTALMWCAAGVVGFSISWLSYSVNLYNDFVGILGLAAVVCVATHLIYNESTSAKLFTSLMASLIANVVTFMFCGTTDAFVGKATGLIKDTPYTEGNILLFIGIKIVVYSLFLVLYNYFVRNHVKSIIEVLQGNMVSYIAAPIVSIVGFYAINLITNHAGIYPGTLYFFPLYITVCVIFVLEYVQIFSSVFWSAKAMKNVAELNVASSIQHNMLPCIFPAFPERTELDIYATMTPAKEVGGDFYDFFLIDDDRLAMVIADVSGKGVPAALFMVIAKTLLKNVAQTGLSPKRILEKVNNQLCIGNEAEMFVTVWIGILEISTGKLICANAGHEYPTIKRAGGDYEIIKDKHGFVLAGMESSRYSEYELQLNHGDRLFLYTDGVTEATNASNQLFGTERMISTLNRNKDSNCELLLRQIKEEIDTFVGEAPQFDDITMLGLELRHKNDSSVKKLKVAPTLESIPQVTAFIEKELEETNISKKVTSLLNIAVDEIISNIAVHSNASAATVSVAVADECVTLRFADNGLPYDPTEKAAPDITLSAESRDIGGLGIFMVKKTMDTVVYEYKDGLNILSLTKHLN